MTTRLLAWIGLALLVATAQAADELPKLAETKIVSTLDKAEQPIRYLVPVERTDPAPLLVSLHSWSGDYRQDHSRYIAEAVKRKWAFVEPNFRGINDHPEACGSHLARQDVLDAIDWMLAQHKIDAKRVYVVGESGGGMMTLLMAGYHPERFAAASAWVPITDLAEWEKFHFHEGKPDRYGEMTVACCGGRPGASNDIDREYYRRSPLYVLHHVGTLPVDINHGVTDGKTGSVPFMHSLHGFNVIARAHGTPSVTQQEMDELWKEGHLQSPQEGDEAADSTYDGRKIFLRRSSGASRVTIFEGGHEGIAGAACTWLEKHASK